MKRAGTREDDKAGQVLHQTQNTMMHRPLVVGAALVLSVGAFFGDAAADAGASPPLQEPVFRLKAIEPHVVRGQPAMLEFTVENVQRLPIQIDSTLDFSGSSSEYRLQVLLDGSELKAKGTGSVHRLLAGVSAGRSSPMLLVPGGSVTGRFNLAERVDLSSVGTYEVTVVRLAGMIGTAGKDVPCSDAGQVQIKCVATPISSRNQNGQGLEAAPIQWAESRSNTTKLIVIPQ